MVDKPGRRKKKEFPWAKVAGVVVFALLIGAVAWEVYWTYVYKPGPEYARIDTTDGPIYIELFPACAPKAVANFVTLADQGFYNDLVWHRIVPGFVIQTGDPNSRGGLNSTRATWGQGGSNSSVPLEVCGYLHNYEGYISMASTSPGGPSTSQFFINLSNSSYPQLDGSYTVFGKVISGMSVVDAIARSPLCTPTTCNPSWPAGEPYPAVFVNDIVMLPGPPTATTTSTT